MTGKEALSALRSAPKASGRCLVITEELAEDIVITISRLELELEAMRIMSKPGT